MRVLVAGSSGVIGRQLIPALEAVGHDVTGLARSSGGGQSPNVLAVDVLDRDAVIRAVDESAPDAIVNMLTAIPARINPKRMSQDFAMTNQLRTEGTNNLLHAAKQFGVSQLVSQGLAYAYEPNGEDLANEDTPLWQDPPRSFALSSTRSNNLKQLLSMPRARCCGLATCTAPAPVTRTMARLCRTCIAAKCHW